MAEINEVYEGEVVETENNDTYETLGGFVADNAIGLAILGGIGVGVTAAIKNRKKIAAGFKGAFAGFKEGFQKQKEADDNLKKAKKVAKEEETKALPDDVVDADFEEL